MLNIRRTRNKLTRVIGLSLLGGTGLLSLAGQTAMAQDSQATTQRWYQVEVILFTQDETLDDETWRNDVALTYPSRWMELKNPEAASEVATDEYGEPVEAPKRPDINRDPFYILPDNLRELNRQADALKYSKSQRLLFHEAWRQPVKSPNIAPAIIIAAGESYGDHRELEGSFSLSVSRYLHVNTNLWLTDFTRNTDQASGKDEHQNGYWPELPTRPSQRRNRPSQTSTSYESAQSSSTNLTEDYDLSSGGSAWDSGSTAWNSGTGGTAWDRNQQTSNEYNFSASKAFRPTNISVFRQNRRMRSGEVHYIDHPKLGMVILVTPYDVPVPGNTESSTAEASNSEPSVETQGSSAEAEPSSDQTLN
ncbi:CsiV family protein [Pseudomaricurvus sp.]|uniref:CsiV family protein n=1 Tax=Pseudomaricurvus sp. TaxID=2004510 RepID=UPI003F6CFF5C